MNNEEWLILNIDDEPAIRYVKTRALQRAGFKVIDAASGYDGLARVESHRPDLVMCDVKMADINGLEVCRRIKEKHPEILVLQVSASFVSSQDRVTGLDLGADSYLTEPVEPEELVAAVRALLRMKKAEDELRALNAQLASEVTQRTRERDRIWTVSSELLAVLADNGFLQSVNPAWSALLGYHEQDLLHTPFTDFFADEDREAVASTLAGLVPGDNVKFQARLRRSDNAYRWIDWTASRDEGLCFALGRDITDEKLRDQELESTQLQLRQSQKMEALGQLTGGIAHDFNNLLTGIIGSLDLLERRLARKRYDDLETFAAVASSSARRAAALTNRLLVFSRMQSLQRTAVDLRATVASAQEMLRTTIGEQVILSFSLPEDLWQVETDANQLEVALLNLVLNARDAMPSGGDVRIELANETLPKGSGGTDRLVGDFVRLRVRDTGSGMSKDVLEKAFDPFFTTKPIGQGTGLGLSMVYGFATQSKGTVRISSAPGKGTTIDLYLPRYVGAAQEDSVEPAELHAASGDGVVLVTEDDPAVRAVVSSVLRDLGYRSLMATTGEEAIDLLASGVQVDLLITDIGLPGMNGVEVAKKARTKRPDLKVLFMTGYAQQASDRGLDGRLTSLIRKPFDIDAFASKVRHCMAIGV